MLSFRLFNLKPVLVTAGLLALLAAQPLNAQSKWGRGEEVSENTERHGRRFRDNAKRDESNKADTTEAAVFSPDTTLSLDMLPLIDTIIPLSEVLAQTSHEAALDSLFKTRLAYYQQHPSQGYSVLFFSAGGNNSRLAADQADEEFRLLYPDVPIYLSYDAPYYKLKAGSFRTRLEASAFLSKIQSSYPNAFVVREMLDVKHLLGIEEPELEEEITEEETENADTTADDSFDF